MARIVNLRLDDELDQAIDRYRARRLPIRPRMHIILELLRKALECEQRQPSEQAG